LPHILVGLSPCSDSAVRLFDNYNLLRSNYAGLPHLDEFDFDAELVENIISTLKRGKAAGLDSLTAEQFATFSSNPVVRISQTF